MSITIVGWRDGSEDAEETRFQTDDWQVAGAHVAYILKAGFRLVIVDDLTGSERPV